MKPLDRQAVFDFVNVEIVHFHNARLDRLARISLSEVLRKKNPYLFRAKNMLSAGDLVRAILDAFLSSSEEKLFGDFLESLAIFVSGQTCDGKKSTAEGLDLEFDHEGVRYLVSIKSGPNWGNSSQVRRLEDNFKRAVIVQRQSQSRLTIQPVLGICYGRAATRDRGAYLRIMGQSFWYLLSGDPDLYLDIIEPIGHRAKEHNDAFAEARAALENRFTQELIDSFCDESYRIDWPRLVAFNSGNLPTNG
ncbi:MAG: PmeII family type II restriction endonuclease [Chloroflexota bacterium]|jgi:hypothetical protein